MTVSREEILTLADEIEGSDGLYLMGDKRQLGIKKTAQVIEALRSQGENEAQKWHRIAMEAGAVTCTDGRHIYPLRDRVKQLEAELAALRSPPANNTDWFDECSKQAGKAFRLHEALEAVASATTVPDHKREDTQFLRAGCNIAHSFATAALSREEGSAVRRAGKVCAYHDGCPPDGPVCHLCAHLQPAFPSTEQRGAE